jgi:hypothetical protein
VARLARQVNQELNLLSSQIQRARQLATEYAAEVAELKTDLPVWTHWGTVIGSAFFVWMGLGQLALLRLGWAWMKEGGLSRPGRLGSPDRQVVDSRIRDPPPGKAILEFPKVHFNRTHLNKKR